MISQQAALHTTDSLALHDHRSSVKLFSKAFFLLSYQKILQMTSICLFVVTYTLQQRHRLPSFSLSRCWLRGLKVFKFHKVRRERSAHEIFQGCTSPCCKKCIPIRVSSERTRLSLGSPYDAARWVHDHFGAVHVNFRHIRILKRLSPEHKNSSTQKA